MPQLLSIRRFLQKLFCLLLLFEVAGCATETVKPMFPASVGLEKPDRVLVYEFAVTAADLTPGGITGSGLDRPVAQTEEDIRNGRALAKALAESLVNALRSRAIAAGPASAAAQPGEATASIRGRFQSTGQGQEGGMGFTLRSKELRTQIQVLQGSGLAFQVVAEAEYTMASSLRPGMAAGDFANAVSTDANRAAQALAERVADYYRKQGWLK
jgi:hypothetical protein